MASSTENFQKGLGELEDTNEYYDSAADLRAGVAMLAGKLREGDVVVYTGAVISTASSIPDYRGPQGVWTRLERGEEAPTCPPMESIAATYGHRVIAALVASSLVRGVVSTNVDGLHMRSGVPVDKLAELHGSLFVEHCRQCDEYFSREFDVSGGSCKKNHETGRQCATCGNPLYDTIVHFNEQLCSDTYNRARAFGEQSKTSLVLGTSMRVKPASSLPLAADDVFIVNLQKTPHDATARRVARAHRPCAIPSCTGARLEGGWRTLCTGRGLGEAVRRARRPNREQSAYTLAQGALVDGKGRV